MFSGPFQSSPSRPLVHASASHQRFFVAHDNQTVSHPLAIAATHRNSDTAAIGQMPNK
jgi:hypothetical protein